MNKNNVLVAIISIGVTWFGFWYFGNDQDITDQIKDIEKREELLKKELQDLKRLNDSLSKVKTEKKEEYKEIEKRSKTKDNEIKDTIDSVYTLSERSLDSTIRHHTFEPYIAE